MFGRRLRPGNRSVWILCLRLRARDAIPSVQSGRTSLPEISTCTTCVCSVGQWLPTFIYRCTVGTGVKDLSSNLNPGQHSTPSSSLLTSSSCSSMTRTFWILNIGFGYSILKIGGILNKWIPSNILGLAKSYGSLLAGRSSLKKRYETPA